MIAQVAAIEAAIESREIDPHGRDPHEPGAKLDAAKIPLRKGCLDQFPMAMEAIADVSAYGAQKYTWGGWISVPNGIERYLDAAARHAKARALGMEVAQRDSALLALEQIKFVLQQEGDMSVIAPAYKQHLLDIIATAKV